MSLIITQTLDSHTTPITALDFSEPYGTLVSASQEDAQPRVWDLLSGEEIGRLRGHIGAVHCLQVEDHVCLTGGADGNVRLWDLRRVDDDDDGWSEGMVHLSDVAEEEEGDDFEGHTNGVRSSEQAQEKDGACARLLEGHTQAVTALYFEDECLVGVGCQVTHFLFQQLIDPSGYWCIRQDTATVGSYHRSMCDDHGHLVGNFTSTNGGRFKSHGQPDVPQ